MPCSVVFSCVDCDLWCVHAGSLLGWCIRLACKLVRKVDDGEAPEEMEGEEEEEVHGRHEEHS